MDINIEALVKTILSLLVVGLASIWIYRNYFFKNHELWEMEVKQFRAEIKDRDELLDEVKSLTEQRDKLSVEIRAMDALISNKTALHDECKSLQDYLSKHRDLRDNPNLVEVDEYPQHTKLVFDNSMDLRRSQFNQDVVLIGACFTKDQDICFVYDVVKSNKRSRQYSYLSNTTPNPIQRDVMAGGGAVPNSNLSQCLIALILQAGNSDSDVIGQTFRKMTNGVMPTKSQKTGYPEYQTIWRMLLSIVDRNIIKEVK
jgi:hypothetical protein